MADRDINALLAQCDLRGEQNMELLKIDTGFSQPLKSFPVERRKNKKDKRGDFLVFEGDIILDNDKPAQEKANITINKYRWPSSRIPYVIDPEYAGQLSWNATIEEGIKHVNRETNVTLHKVRRGSDPGDHIFFSCEEDSDRMHAIIGYRPGRGKHEVIMSGDFEVGHVIHEIGHALGLWHEHTRSDRDEHIEVLWDNVRDNSICVFKVWEDFSIPYGPYDYASIMHYNAINPAFAINGRKPIMKPRDDRWEILGQRMELSRGDIDGINKMYPA